MTVISGDAVAVPQSRVNTALRIIVSVQLVLIAIVVALAVVVWTSYDNLKASADALRALSAHLQANSSVMQMAIGDSSSIVDDLANTSTDVCGPLGMAVNPSLSEAVRTGLLNLCQPAGSQGTSWADTIAFFNLYTSALKQRLSAESGAEFLRTKALYEQALRSAQKVNAGGRRTVDRQWEVRALEGIAYADMQLGNYQAALEISQKAISEARGFADYPVYVFANLTHLKTMCRLRTPRLAVRSAYADAMRGLKMIAARYPNKTKYHQSAVEDLSTAQNDDEVTLYCSYASLAR